MNEKWGDVQLGVVTAVLRECGVLAELPVTLRAPFALPIAPDLAARAQLEDDWLLFDLPMRDVNLAASDLGRLVAANTGLPGGAKVVLARAGGIATTGGHRARADLGLHVRAEVVLGDDADPASRVHDACAGLRRGAGVVRDNDEAGLAAPEQSADGLVVECIDDLAQRCEEAGWKSTRRPNGELVVDLEVPGGFFQAVIATAVSAHTRVSTIVSTAEGFPTPECEAALWVLLLRASGVVRMARSVSEETPIGRAVGFEVAFGSMPTAAELNHALSALSIACRVSGREAQALASTPLLAREYLKRNPWCSVPGP